MASEGGNPEIDYKKAKTAGGLFFRGSKNRTELKNDKEVLSSLAKTDFLTDLPNRRQFEIDLKAGISNFERKGVPFTIINIDLKDFKKINETPELGFHVAGDKALKFFGDFLKQHTRPSDYLCRPGGDEFLVILNETNEDQGGIVLNHLQKSLIKIKEDLGPEHKIEQLVNMNASVKQWGKADSYEDFMEELDKKMYQEKRGEKNV